ncbi:MAG TPA: hypothetical protein VEI97_13335, partial [bacterium]|nr:hypothetical protein [bacterium]
RIALALSMALLGLGCGVRQTLPPASRTLATTDPPEFNLSQAPGANTELTDGKFYLAGTIDAEAGLAQDEPLLFVVLDEDSGLTSELDVLELVTNWANAGDSFEGDTTFDPLTGAFILDGNKDFRVDAGNKTLKLVAKDTLDRETTWTVSVDAESYGQPSLADLGPAREAYLQQARDALAAYRDFLGSMTFASGFDNVSLDVEYLALLIEYMDGRINDPLCVDAAGIGYAFEDAVEDLIAEAGSPGGQSEETYRTGMMAMASLERERAEGNQQSAVESQLVVHPWVEGILAVRARELAFYEHTWIDTEVLNPTSTTTRYFNFLIYQDEGAPLPLYDTPLSWDPQNLVPNSADPENPGFQLSIRFTGSIPGHGQPFQVSSIAQEGFDLIPGYGERDIVDTASYGHLIQPLINLWNSPYLYYGGG